MQRRGPLSLSITPHEERPPRKADDPVNSSGVSEICDGIFVGGSDNLDCGSYTNLASRHFTDILDVGHGSEFDQTGASEGGTCYTPIPFRDNPDPDDAETMTRFLAAVWTLKRFLSRGPNPKVLVMCRKGISRSVSVVLAYQILFGTWSYLRQDLIGAVEKIVTLRSIADPAFGFLIMLKSIITSIDRFQQECKHACIVSAIIRTAEQRLGPKRPVGLVEVEKLNLFDLAFSFPIIAMIAHSHLASKSVPLIQ
jgi:hypothetical protein